MRSYSRCHVVAAIGVALVGACSDPSLDTEPAELEVGCTRLGAPLIEHACFHAQFGPFVAVAGSATRTFPAAGPNLNTVHTHYTVTLPGSPGSNEGTVKYRPARTGDWALLTSPGVDVVVLDAAGSTVPTLLRHAVPTAECAVLRDVHVVSLVAAQTYRFVIGPSPSEQIGIVIEKLSDFESFFFADSDGDGFGNPELGVSTSCVAPAGHVADDTDCDDSNAAVSPGAAEVCDDLDNDCDGVVDDGAVPGTFYRDADGDGFGDPGVTVQGCSPPSGYVAAGGDCDDAAVVTFPGAAELCDVIDNDCDGVVDDGAAIATYYADVDGDGFGDAAAAVVACVQPAGHVANAADCDDANAAVHPGAAETCDTIDNDCDGAADEDGGATFYVDSDGDGFGDPTMTTTGCTAPAGHVADGSDCDDRNAEVNPAEHEVCDGLDNDCDGTADNLPDPLGEVIEHGCLHAQHGPFVTVDAAPPDAAAAPDVSAHHTAYSVNLLAGAGGHVGDVELSPDETTDIAILVGPDVAITVLDTAGQSVEIEDERGVACPALQRARVVELAGGATYRLRLGPTPAAQALLVIEELGHHDHDEGDDHGRDTGATDFFRDGDGDGFGDPSVLVEACTAPAGYVVNAADCDDAHAAIHPGAAEICDTVDNDCDGAVDVVGGQDTCACAPVTLEATRSYCPWSLREGVVDLAAASELVVPAVVPVVRGGAGNGYATLTFRESTSGREVSCHYRAERPRRAVAGARPSGRRYLLTSCSNGAVAGAAVRADRAALRLELGDPWRGRTIARVDLDVVACGAT